MYSVTVRDHVMVAHRLRGAVFGPAQALHGATYIVDAEFRRAALGDDGIVVDIGRAAAVLAAVLDPLRYRDLDALDEFRGRNTTTEFLAQWIFGRLRAAIAAGELGPDGEALSGLKITLHESHLAWAAFEGTLP